MTNFDAVIVKGATRVPEPSRERAILVGVDRPENKWSLESSLDELERLANTAGVDAVVRTTQRLSSPNPRTFVGAGKVAEISHLCTSLELDVVIFDDELSPSQQSNLEKELPRSVKLIDRTALILDIFALHATSKEGRLQVRLAQNQYLLPRLRGMWAHLASNRMGGGVGSRFGEGESQLEVDRRLVRKRITSIKRELEHLSAVRRVQRETRYESGIYKVALAGYTNAGKSSLLNALTGSDVLAYDKLFATLDSTTRKLSLPEGRTLTLTDTVGFIQKLPTTLVEAFKSTLDEITGADLILHVVDASSDNFTDLIDAVNSVLDQIGAHSISCLLVFNKCDLLSAEELSSLKSRYEQAIFASAHTGFGLDALTERISSCIAALEQCVKVLIPYTRGDLVSIAHSSCTIVNESHNEQGTLMTILASPLFVDRFMPFTITD